METAILLSAFDSDGHSVSEMLRDEVPKSRNRRRFGCGFYTDCTGSTSDSRALKVGEHPCHFSQLAPAAVRCAQQHTQGLAIPARLLVQRAMAEDQKFVVSRFRQEMGHQVAVH